MIRMNRQIGSGTTDRSKSLLYQKSADCQPRFFSNPGDLRRRGATVQPSLLHRAARPLAAVPPGSPHFPQKTVDRSGKPHYNKTAKCVEEPRPAKRAAANGGEWKPRRPKSGQPLPSGPRRAGRALPLQSRKMRRLRKLGWYREHFAPMWGQECFFFSAASAHRNSWIII